MTSPAGCIEFIDRIATMVRDEAASHDVRLAVDGHSLDNGRVQVTLTVTFPAVIAARFNAIFGKKA